MRHARNIFLTGFMGCGKSATGRALARRLGRRFLDTDAVVERMAGMTVAAVFRTRGERAFRSLEEGAVRRACRGRRLVVSLGGGSLLSPKNRKAVRRTGVTVYLSCGFDRLWRYLRRARGGRPLLSSSRRDALKLYRARRPHYLKADLTVRPAGKSAPAAARAVERALSEAGWL